MIDTAEMGLAPECGTNKLPEPPPVPKEEQTYSGPINLLLFSVGEVFFGIDADQVTEIAAYTGEKGEDLFWFHEEMGYGNEKLSYHSPTVITIRVNGISPYQVIIDAMEDVAEFNSNDIRIFPALLEPFSLLKGMWGIPPWRGNMVLLVDFQRLGRKRALKPEQT